MTENKSVFDGQLKNSISLQFCCLMSERLSPCFIKQNNVQYENLTSENTQHEVMKICDKLWENIVN